MAHTASLEVLSCTVMGGVEVFASACTESGPEPLAVKVSAYAPSAAELVVAGDKDVPLSALRE